MSRTFFLDTSALIKLYHQEAGTEQVEEIFRQAEDSLIISELAIVELYSSFARKVRTGEVTPQAQEEALRNFEDDCVHRFVIEPLGSAILYKAKELLQKYSNTKALRTLDSLQLGTCLTARARGALVFVCADTRLVDVGQLEGLQTLNPESSSIDSG